MEIEGELQVAQSLIICRLRGSPNCGHLGAIREAAVAYPGLCSVVIVVPAESGLPDAETRAAAIATLRDLEGHISAWVAVLKGGAMRRAAFRAVISTLSLAIRPPFPLVVFASAARAQEWLALRGLSTESAEVIDPPEETSASAPR